MKKLVQFGVKDRGQGNAPHLEQLTELFKLFKLFNRAQADHNTSQHTVLQLNDDNPIVHCYQFLAG
ncbi:MAG: hypothetical protein ACRDAF_11605 [Aeromonas veronii]